MHGHGTPRLPRFARRCKPLARSRAAVMLEVLRKLLTGGAALAALSKPLW